MSGNLSITICIPVFNAKNCVARCIRSVLNNMTPDSELLVVDNSSTDGTTEIVRNLLDGINRSQLVVNEKNIGRIENWNRCLELATGRYIKFALANDIILTGAVNTLASTTRRFPDAVLICSNGFALQELPNDIPATKPPLSEIILTPSESINHFAKLNNFTGGPNGILINNSAIQKANLRFCPEFPYVSDLLFAIDLTQLGETVVLETETYAMDLGVVGRYHHKNKNVHSYFIEQKKVATVLENKMQGQYLTSLSPYTWMYDEYLRYLDNGEKITLSQTVSFFQEAKEFKRKAILAILKRDCFLCLEKAAVWTRNRLEAHPQIQNGCRILWRRMKKLFMTIQQ